jgi:hypothetical protein
MICPFGSGAGRPYRRWDANIVKIDYPLLDTAEFNQRQHRGPDQYFGDPIPRARRFIASKSLPDGLQLSAQSRWLF